MQGAPLSLNLYTYCYNNPILNFDPSGHDIADAVRTARIISGNPAHSSNISDQVRSARVSTGSLSVIEIALAPSSRPLTSGDASTTTGLEPILKFLTDTGELDAEESVLKERADGLYAQMEVLANENARKAQDQNDVRERYTELKSRYESVKERLAEVVSEKQSRRVRRENILRFMDTVRERENLLAAFDEPLWRASVERMTVRTKKDIIIRFRDGQEAKVDITKQRAV